MQFQVNDDQFDEILAFVRGEAKRLQVPAKMVHRMELACEEAIVNIIHYAHPNHSESFSVECSLSDASHFEVVIRDEGPPFNPLEVNIDIQKNVDVSRRKIGGLGIHLIRKLIDEAVYQREGKSNILRLILRLEVPQAL
ncbi:MAG: Serine-protein kinase RsbW [Chlamydiales bacterium]|nr:Serine-protein kinase RsbW [Chlamydiales bacterium]MCH9636017.1 Serine-protein kinase RsbW [Chlamydiales bacterium]MCH9704348.1 ATP-binding protein [Chlamydiota bacterium]